MKQFPGHRSHGPQGLYDPANEHDACGVAFVVDMHGRRSRDIVDKAITALVQVSLNSHSNASLERAKSLLGSFDEVLACWHTAGDEDFVLKVLVCDMAAYERFISHKLSTVPGISKIRTAFVLSAVKESTRIPLNDGELENNGCAAPRRDRKNRES